MTAEKYKRAGDLFHRLRSLPKPDRASALDLACKGDAELRSEVVGLLEGDEDAGGESFLQRPAIEAAAALLMEPQADELPVPELVAGRYRVGARICTGGMGVVYEAEDLRLSRRVALKILPGSMVRDQERYLRFQKEAHAIRRVADDADTHHPRHSHK